MELLKKFLVALRLDALRPAGRATTWNHKIEDEGYDGRVWQEKVRDLSGKDPWVAEKAILKGSTPLCNAVLWIGFLLLAEKNKEALL